MKTGRRPKWGVRSLKTLGLTALWCGVTAVGFAIKNDEETRRGGLTIPLMSMAWAAAFLAGGSIGWSLATVQALIGVARPGAGRRVACGSLLICALIVTAAILVVTFWERIHPPPPQTPQGFHGDSL
jgi:hypothetical protein